ncbi:MAG: tripartite tricarboxylate transporter permease [Burkholderiaceae bacterium]
MLEILSQSAGQVLTLHTLGLMCIGTVAGLLAGGIPGFTIAMAVVLTLPFTFGMEAIQGLATMIAVFVGGLSGGLMSGILTGIPGTPSSVATTFDGFPLARRGQAGLALGVGVWSSFFGGVISAVLLVTVAPPLARVGLEFGPWDYFSLVVFALSITASLAGDQLLKGLIAGALGLLVATVGEDEINGVARFNFGFDELKQGFAFLPVLIGLFAFSQLLHDVRDTAQARRSLSLGNERVRIEHLRAAREVLSRYGNLLRSSMIGVFTGILPAAGSSISNILAYDQAKKAAADPDAFGKGEIDGVIAPEAANNATAGGSLITMMALGIPGDVVTAVMLGALLIHDVVPSPSFIRDQPVIANAIFIAFLVAHFLMLALQSVTLRLFVLVTRVPMYVLTSVILAYCAIGVFALHNVEFDLWALLGFGVLGYIMRNLGFPLAPMILGVVLGRIAELNLSRAIAISDQWQPFFTRPWSLLFVVLTLFSIGFGIYQRDRVRGGWTRFFMPALALGSALPLAMMPGMARPIAAAALAAWAIYALWRGGRRREQAAGRG